MAKKRRAHDEEAWRNAKKVCRLNARQIEMARALGMNPKKLPGLRPSPHQRWKLPVGEFIEELYEKRFGGDVPDHHPHLPKLETLKPSPAQPDAHSSESVSYAASRVDDLVCYLMNLADDLQGWLVHGSAAPEVLRDVSEELREIATALETGASIFPVPSIPSPPRPKRPTVSRRAYQEPTFDDDIPF